MAFKRHKNKFLILYMAVAFFGCSNNNDTDNQPEDKSLNNFAIPSAIRAAALPATGTLTAQLLMDGSVVATNPNVDINATEVTLSATVRTGQHTFTIRFAYTDPVYGGPWDLANATKTADIGAGSTTNLNFDSGDYNYPDDDGDTLTNLAELDESTRSNPGTSTCVFGSAQFDTCELG